jgi:hypothetical protein
MSIQIPKMKGLKFTLIIGDDGAVLALMNGTKLMNRLFASSPALSDRREISSLIAKYPSVPIYVLLDSMEQSYTQQTLPAVSSLSINKLVKKRLERDFSESDIKSAVSMGRSTSGRRDWMYMFISTPMNTALSEWLNYITSLPNKFLGIHLLPVEMESFLNRLNKHLYKKGEEEPEWRLVVTHNKTGGFRQVVFKNKRVIFTRLIPPGKENLPDIIAGSIEQETLNTLDYLRRLSFEDGNKIDITMIVASEIKNSLEGSNIRDQKLSIFTPYEAAQLLQLKAITNKDDKFADLLLINNFITSRPVLKFFNPETKRLNNLLLIYTWSFHAMVAIIPIFILMCLISAYQIFNVSKQIGEVENNKANIERKWKNARKTDNYDIDDANKITDAVTIYNRIAKNSKPPLVLIEKMILATQQEALVKSLNWHLEDDKVVAIFNMDFTNTGTTIEALFSNFEAFTTRLQNAFKEYELVHSKLPERITFGENTRVIPVQVKINEK